MCSSHRKDDRTIEIYLVRCDILIIIKHTPIALAHIALSADRD
jgi:hypothetical protein